MDLAAVVYVMYKLCTAIYGGIYNPICMDLSVRNYL
jgi:hypothetical protein